MSHPASAKTWFVQIADKAYGPYTHAQILAYIQEGRIKAASRIAAGADQPFRPASEVESFANAFAFGKSNRGDASGEANMIIFAELFSGASERMMAELARLGRSVELSSGLFLLRTRFSSAVVRNTVTQTLNKGDKFVVVDSTRDRLAWYNLGPEVDARIREAWNAPLPAND